MLTYSDILQALAVYDEAKGLRRTFIKQDDITALRSIVPPPGGANDKSLTLSDTYTLLNILIRHTTEPGSASRHAIDTLTKKIPLDLLSAMKALEAGNANNFENFSLINQNRFPLLAAKALLELGKTPGVNTSENRTKVANHLYPGAAAKALIELSSVGAAVATKENINSVLAYLSFKGRAQEFEKNTERSEEEQHY